MMVHDVFSNQFGIVDASRDFDYAGWAEWSCFLFFFQLVLFFFFHILKPRLHQLFRRMLHLCFIVTLQKLSISLRVSRLWLNALFWWTYPLIFLLRLSQKRTALQSNEIIWIYISSKSISLLKAVEHLPLYMNIYYFLRSSIEPSSLSGRTRRETFLQHSRVYSSGIILLVWYIPSVDFQI